MVNQVWYFTIYVMINYNQYLPLVLVLALCSHPNLQKNPPIYIHVNGMGSEQKDLGFRVSHNGLGSTASKKST